MVISLSPISKVILKDIHTNTLADWSKCFLHILSQSRRHAADLHDLEGAVGGVEELELLDGALRDSVESGATPAPLHQADGLCCKPKKKDKLVPLLAKTEKSSERCVFHQAQLDVYSLCFILFCWLWNR